MLVSHDFDVRLVAASTWKWALKLARRGALRDKNESRDLAKRLFADVSDVVDLLLLQKYQGRAEALLLAAHCQWAEGNLDPLATRVDSQIAIRKIQQRRVAQAPIVID